MEAWDDFCSRNPRSFCKSLISSYTKTDMLDNNVCESFNAFILEARDKPILQMLEAIRSKLMTKQHNIEKSLAKCNDVICPNVRKKIYKIEEWTKFFDIRPAPVNKYEARYYGGSSYIVDLVGRRCSCRDWELIGIPCCHALACIHYVRGDVVNYVDPYFLKSNATQLYTTHGLVPMHGEEDWPKDNLPPILPPKFQKPPGRPKKLRKRSSDEVRKKTSNKLTRHGIRMKCRICGGIGHNKRSCKELTRGSDLSSLEVTCFKHIECSNCFEAFEINLIFFVRVVHHVLHRLRLLLHVPQMMPTFQKRPIEFSERNRDW